MTWLAVPARALDPLAAMAPSGGDYMPHGYCYLWNPLILWLHVVSDALITFSYYCIPIILIYFLRKNRDIPFNRIFWMFGTFILACGTTHLMEIWNIWHSNYLEAGIVKAVTAAVSVVTAAMLIPLVPKAMSLPKRLHLEEVNRKLEREIAEGRRFNAPIETSLRRWASGGLALSMLLTAIMGALSWEARVSASRESDLVAHTHAVLKAIEAISERTAQAQIDARNFARVGGKQMLDNYQAAQAGVRKNFFDLRSLTSDDPHQQVRLKTLESQIGEALQLTQEIIRQNRQISDEEMQDSIRIDTALGSTVSEMEAAETALLEQRSRKTAAGRRLTNYLTALATVSGLGFLTLAGFIVDRQINMGASARAQVVALNAELEQRVKQRTAALQAEMAERERAEARNLRLASIVDCSNEAILSKDLDGTILSWNRGAEQLCGYSELEMVGKNVRLIVPEDRQQEETKLLKEIEQGGEVSRYETTRLRRDGCEVHVSLMISPIRDRSGQIVGASSIAHDITERKEAEESLRQSDARRQFALEASRLGDWEIDLATQRATRSLRHDQIFGYESLLPEWDSEIFLRHVHPEERDMAGRNLNLSATMGTKLEIECRILCANGEVRWILARGDANRDSSGRPTRLFGTVEDITERKKTEEALRASEERLRLAINGGRLGTWHWNLENGELKWSSLCLALFGFPPDKEMSYEAFLGSLHPEDRARVDQSVQQSLASHSDYDVQFRAIWPDGTERWITSRGGAYYNAAGQPLRMEGIVLDITEGRQAQKAAQESEERFHAMANGIPQLAWMAEADGHIFWYNERWYEYTGTNFEQMEGWAWQTVHDPEVLPQVMERWKGAIATSQPFDMEFPLRRADGLFRTFLTRVMPVKDSAGCVVRWFGTNTDISERKQSEELLARQAAELDRSRQALEEQTRMLKLVLDSMGEGLIAADLQGRFLIWNDAAKELMGRDATDLPSEQWTPHYQVFLADGVTPYPPDRLPLVRALRGESVRVELMVEHPLRNGVFLEVTARPLKDNLSNLCGGVAVLRDITDRKAAEREIQHLNQGLELRVKERTAELQAANQELEAFTYSVSHDLRAPLRHMSGFTRILVEDFGPTLPAEALKHLQRIEQGAHKMGLLVDELLNLTRVGRQALAVQVTGLSSIVEDVLTVLEPETKGRQIEWKIADLPFVECDPTLILQVFQNLIGNAVKYSRPRSPAVIEIGQIQQNQRPTIFVRDNGVGFSMKYADKLFGVFQRLHRPEDFEGTGVGLATVHRIIHKHGGRVWAEAELDRGATFFFTLSGGEQAASQNAAAAGGHT